MVSRRIAGFARVAVVSVLAVPAAVWIVDDSRTRYALDMGMPDLVPGRYSAFGASLRAEQLFAAGDSGGAGQAAREALVAKPGDVIAIRTLALAAEKHGAFQKAAGLMAAGANWGWRDTPTQAWLFANLARNGELAGAILHGEALAARGELTDMVFPVFAGFAAEPSVTAQLVESLERGGRWRPAFFAYMRKATPAVHPALGNLMMAMQKSTAPPGPGDVSPLLEAMLDAGDPRTARALWGKMFWRPALPMPEVVDGDFENAAAEPGSAQGRSVFEWNFDPTAEAYLVADPETGKGLALHVVGAGNDRGSLVTQGLALPPGKWQLTLRLRSQHHDLISRMRIGIRCRRANQWLTLPLDEPAKLDHWQSFSLPFAVTDSCRGQELAVEAIGAAAGDPLGVWIDDFAVRPDR